MSTQFLFKTASDQPAFSAEVAQRAFEPERPYPQNPQVIVYRTRFMQLRAYYMKPAPLTPHPDLPQVYFADDIDFQDRTSGLIEWTRVYTTLPTSWNDFASDSYSYPGILWLVGPGGRGRNPFAHIVTTKITRDYFAVGNFATFQDAFTNYDNFASASWTKTGCNASANAANIPACAGGTQVAAKLVESNAQEQHLALQTWSGLGLPVWVGAFLKAGERTKAQVWLVNAGGIAVGNIAVDLETGTVTETNGNGTIAAIGDGWWRVGVSANIAASNTGQLYIVLCNSGGSTTYTGDGVSGLYAWRGQAANGNSSPYATVPPTLAGDGTTNYPIQSADLIPQKFGTQFLYNPNVALGSNIAIEYLSNGSLPNYSTYNAYQVADAANSNSYSIESQDSTQSLWYGAIWERQRRFVKAI